MAVTIRENDIKASNLYLLGTLLNFIGALYDTFNIDVAGLRLPVFGMLLILNVLTVAMGFCIRSGYLWAKVIFLVFFAWNIIRFDLAFQNYSLLQTLLALAMTVLDVWVAFIITRDLRRKPTADAGVAQGGHNRPN